MRLSKPVIALSSLALSAAALTGLPGSPANASPGSSEYAQWTLKDESGTVRVANVGGEGDFITVGADASLESGSDTWLSAQTPFGLEFGSSRGTKYLSTALAAGSPSAIVTYTFTDSGRVGTWAFALGDIDTESVTVRATDPQGNDINVDFWFQGVFNYCGANGTRPSTCSGSPGTNVPQWDAATATLVGNGTDTSGATGWFRPTQAVRTLTIEMTGLAGFPAYQTWMAADDDESPPQFLVTVAARTCPTYQDVMANQARNNVMESLEDLGADSIYPGGGTTPVQPSVETDPATGQSACQPLSGWTFGFGDGFAGADTGPYGSLSTVANLNGSATTLPTTELLDSLGNPTGQTLDGAATIALDDTQTFIAQGGGWLTAQGGLPGTPLNGISNIAFGILRCAIDNVNGDNVEYVNFPAGTKHVFCYAYYVDTTPASGKITITKEVEGPDGGAAFDFTGNLSYDSGGSFSLRNGESQTFDRQSGQKWTVTESDSAPYTLKDITCTGGANVTTNVAQRTVSIDLGADERVRCTFTNHIEPTAALEVYKVTQNGTGQFYGTVNGPGSYSRKWEALTTTPGQPVQGYTGAPIFPGTYTVNETPVPGWNTRAACGYLDDTTIIRVDAATIDVPITSGDSAVCLFLNTFDASGSITIRSTVVGGSGPVNVRSEYVLARTAAFPGDLLILGNNAWNTPVSGSFTGPLAMGTYLVQGNPPANTAAQTWSVDSVTCSSGGVVIGNNANVTLDPTNPNVTCDYVYRAQPVNPTLTISKTVTAGDNLRSGPVVIEVTCSTSSGPFVATGNLPIGSTTRTVTLTLPTDTTSCSARETDVGVPAAVDPGAIVVTANADLWPEGTTQTVPTGTALPVSAASTTGAPLSATSAGPCVTSTTGVAPLSSTAECTLTFTATGGTITSTSTWTAPGGSGSGTDTSTFAVSPGNAYSVTFANAYTGTATKSTTTRVLEAQSNPGSLVVTKTVPEGNELRTGPVTLSVQCVASAKADPQSWPKIVTLGVNATSTSRTISVPGNARNLDLCNITETSTGITPDDAGSIKPTWNGKKWKSTATKSLLLGETAKVTSTATSGAPVTQTTSAPCALSGKKLTADREGTCTVSFTAEGTPTVSVVTTYPLGESVGTIPGRTSTLAVVNRYASTPRTLIAKRTVRVTATPPCPLDVSAAKSVPANGTTLLIRSVATGDGCGITDIEVTCPTARATPRGDYGCTVRRESNDRVYVTTYGKKNLTVTAKIVATGPDHTKTTWTRTWSVT